MSTNQSKLAIIIATGSAILVSQAIQAKSIENSSLEITESDRVILVENQNTMKSGSRGDRASGSKRPVSPAGTN